MAAAGDRQRGGFMAATGAILLAVDTHLALITALGTFSPMTPLAERRPLVKKRSVCWVVIS